MSFVCFLRTEKISFGVAPLRGAMARGDLPCGGGLAESPAPPRQGGPSGTRTGDPLALGPPPRPTPKLRPPIADCEPPRDKGGGPAGSSTAWGPPRGAPRGLAPRLRRGDESRCSPPSWAGSICVGEHPGAPRPRGTRAGSAKRPRQGRGRLVVSPSAPALGGGDSAMGRRAQGYGGRFKQLAVFSRTKL